MRRLLLLLGVALLMWLLLVCLLLGPSALWLPTLDIQLHNTYLVIGSYAGQLCLLVLVALLMLAADSVKRRAKESKLLLSLLVGGGLLLEILLDSFFRNIGFTIYPPLSPDPTIAADPFAAVRWISLGLQGFVLLVVLWAGIRLLRLVRQPAVS
ncbi:hypothetical protein [Hymenobacter pini]|uniref:hypothetical protein n=1 Tax=Hymenobacter pini TaxID=2880879 RepID=UPI001CF2FE1C|nr:hypothetical protein [Hymenobacter pini]MCA8833168.1 hypothetical protein [Hymenobacter pini]